MTKGNSFSVEPGMKGVLISCFRKRESSCVLEVYNLFEQYFDSLGYSDQSLEFLATDSIENKIEKELQELRSKNKKTKRFLNISMGDLECLVFIKTSSQLIPSQFVTKILTDSMENGIKKTRYCQRLIPIDATCYANINDLKKTFEAFVEQYFPSSGDSKTYCLCIESRFNSSLHKEAIIKELTFMVPSIYKVSFDNSQLTIVIQIFKNICGISVLEDYHKFKKFNIQQCSVQSCLEIPIGKKLKNEESTKEN